MGYDWKLVKKEHKSTVCREIIKYDISTPDAYAKAHDLDIFQVCYGCLNTTCDLLEKKYEIFKKGELPLDKVVS